MELLGLIIVFPILLLVLGLVFISLTNLSFFWFLPALLLFVVLIGSMRGSANKGGDLEGIDHFRKSIVVFSISLFLPILMKYVLDIFGSVLPVIIFGLLFGFGLVIWGIFIKNHRVLVYSNIIGGALIIIYMYVELWSLGQLPRIVAAAFGLLMAVIISVVKLKDKLV